MKRLFTLPKMAVCKRYSFLLFLLFLSNTIYSQTVSWTSGYPKLDATQVVVLEDERTLQIRFTPLSSAISNANIVITLPSNVSYTGATSVTSGVTISPSSSGSTVTLSVTSNGNQLLQNAEVEFNVNFKALCNAEVGTPQIGISVNSGTTLVSGGNKTITPIIAVPSVTLESSSGTITANQNQDKAFAYTLKTTTAVQASSAKITFITDLTTTLSSFVIAGSSITPTITTSATTRSYTFSLTTTQLGGKIDATGKAITFNAQSSTCGAHSISTTTQFPATSICKTTSGATTALSITGSATTPKMTHVSTTYADFTSDAPLDRSAINMDGTTLTNIKTQFKCTLADAYSTVIALRPYGQFAYIDTSKVYIQIGTNPKRKIQKSEITFVSGLNNSVQYGYKKTGLVGKPVSISITIPEVILNGETITCWVATVNGDINSNGSNNVYFNYHTNTINGFVSNVTSVKNACGYDGTGDVASLRINYMNAPHYREIPSPLSFKSGNTKSVTIYVAPGTVSTSTNTQTRFRVTLPSWLTLAAPMTLTSNIDGSGTTYAGTASGNTITFSNIGASTAAYLHLSYVAGTCGGSNQIGQIAYGVDQIWTGGTLTNASQVFQNVTFLCESEGVELTNFGLQRITKGLKDNSPEDRIPDNGTPAPDTDIRHDLYVVGDKGQFTWDGTIVGSSTYTQIEMPLSSPKFTIQETGGSLNLGGYKLFKGTTDVTSSATFTFSSAGSLVVSYPSGLTSGDQFTVVAPFTVAGATNEQTNVQTALYVKTSASAPREGKDNDALQIGLYSLDRLNHFSDPSQLIFTTNAAFSQYFGYTDIFHSGKLASPYFPREVRFHEYIDQLEWNLPAGYQLVGNLSVTRNTPTSDTKTLTPTISTTTTGKKFVYDVASLYDLTFTGASSLAAGKWQLPDDAWTLSYNSQVQVTRAAKKGSSTMTRIATYKNPSTGVKTNTTLTITFINNADAINLDISPKVVPAYGVTVEKPIITISNPNATVLQDAYIYMDGNVENVIFNEVNGSPITGIGYEGRWLNIGSLAVGASKSYELSYTHKGLSTCKNDTVTVYTVAGFDATFTPNTSGDLASSGATVNNIGYSDFYVIQVAPAVLTASLTSDRANDTIPAFNNINPPTDTNYTVTAEFNTSASDGAIKNPEMSLTVPIGQELIGATIEYPIGSTPINVSNLTALLGFWGSSSDKTSDRTQTLSFKDAYGADLIIPGKLAPDASTAKTVRIHLKFQAECNTNFKGIQYKGIISGTSACNAAASGNGNQVVSHVLYPDVTQNYLFDDIKITTQSGVKAFNEIKTTDSLFITIKKITGSVDNMTYNDYLSVVMPEDLDVVGNYVFYEGTTTMMSLNGTTDTITSNTTTASVRTVKIPLPVDVYDAATNKGVGAEVTYKIPVEYNPSLNNRVANPVDSIISVVFAEAQFGTCPPVLLDAGHGKDSIALVTADSIPYIVYIGDTAKLEILSNGFSGSWYPNETSSTIITSDNPWLYAPNDTLATGDTTFYFSSIINGHDYGRLPFSVTVFIYPWFDINLDTFQYACTNDYELITKGGGMDISYQWYYNFNPIAINGTDSSYLSQNTPGKYYVIITDTVGNTLSSDTMDLYFNRKPIFTKNLPTRISACMQNDHLAELEVQNEGTHLMYQWFRNGIEIEGATTNKYTALRSDSSAYFRVWVKTLCGDSIMSEQVYVSFCEPGGDIKRSVFLTGGANVDVTPSLGQHYVDSQSDFVFTVEAKDGFSLKYLTVTSDSPIWNDQGGIRITPVDIDKTITLEEAKKAEVRIMTVTKSLVVTINGVSPVSNTDLPEGYKVWSNKGLIYIQTPKADQFRIYTVTGQLYRQQEVGNAGEYSYPVPSGFYIVEFEGGITAKVLVR